MTDKEKSIREMQFIKNATDRLPVSLTSAELIAKDFPPINWVVPGIIPTGLTIVSGAPKLGKSWLLLGIAFALSVGGRVLGKIEVRTCEVLFLALEDTPRRLKDRLIQIGARGSGNLYMPTQWPRGDEALMYFDAWMLKHPNTKVIFVDTLAKISGVEDANSYQETYLAIGKLKSLADKYGIAVIAVHHNRKNRNTDDFISNVSGSVGFTGAADTLIVMDRPRGGNDGTLSVTGRDVEENEYGILFDPVIGTWELLEKHCVPTRVSVLKRDNGSSRSAYRGDNRED